MKPSKQAQPTTNKEGHPAPREHGLEGQGGEARRAGSNHIIYTINDNDSSNNIDYS